VIVPALMVDEDHGAAAGLTVRAFELAAELALEAPAVEEARERVEVGEVLQLALEAVALRDVLDLHDDVAHAAAAGHDGHAHATLERGAGAVQQPELVVDHVLASVDELVDRAQDAFHAAAVEQRRQARPGELGLRVAEPLAQRAVHAGEPAAREPRGADQGQAHRAVLERAAEAGLALAGVLAGPLALGAEVLVHAPREDGGDRGGEDEGAVDRGEAPRVSGVVVDRIAIDDAHQPVVHDDERDRDEERAPVLVQRDDDDHDEEHEMRLDRAAGQVHGERAGHAQPERRDR
jgi:hypothetical protein